MHRFHCIHSHLSFKSQLRILVQESLITYIYEKYDKDSTVTVGLQTSVMVNLYERLRRNPRFKYTITKPYMKIREAFVEVSIYEDRTRGPDRSFDDVEIHIDQQEMHFGV